MEGSKEENSEKESWPRGLGKHQESFQEVCHDIVITV